MLPTLKKLTDRYNRYMTMLGRRRAREVLLKSSDRLLKDAGFSRELLEQGVDAWPWAASDARQDLPPLKFDDEAAQKAIRELQSYKDSELHDLGITRGRIRDAVYNGREGFESDVDKRAA